MVVITVDDDHSKGEGAVATRGGGQPRQRTLRTLIERWRYRFIPDHVIGEILTKRWIDSAIPFTVLIVVLCTFYVLLPTMFQPNALAIAARQLGAFPVMKISQKKATTRKIQGLCAATPSKTIGVLTRARTEYSRGAAFFIPFE